MRAFTTLVLMLLSATVVADVVTPVAKVESYVRIRSAPDASSEAIGRLHKSKPRPHVRTLDGWYEVELEDGTTGFVSSDWSVLVADEKPDAPDESDAEVAKAKAESAPDPVAVVEQLDEPAPTMPAQTSAEQETPEKKVFEAVAVEEPVPTDTAATPVADAVDEEGAPAESPPVEVSADGEVDQGSKEPVELIAGPAGPPGPPGPPGEGAIKGTENFLVKFKARTLGGNSQIYDDGNRVGIGTDEPGQRLDVNGSLQIHDRTSAVAGLMITQIGGEAGYILHNQASTLTIGAGSVDRITIDKDGNVGFGVNRPEYPLQLASGAYVSAGGVWTNSSSRALKENIESLTLEEALAALSNLEPVEFNYLSDAGETHLGFIAEDVPELVATTDRKSLSPMDIVAVLTRVVQEQQARIRSLEERIAEQD